MTGQIKQSEAEQINIQSREIKSQKDNQMLIVFELRDEYTIPRRNNPMNKIFRILAITFMSVMTGLYALVFFADMFSLTQFPSLSGEGGKVLAEIFTPSLWIEAFASLGIVAIGIIGIVTSVRKNSENMPLGLAAGAMMVNTFFGTIGKIQLYSAVTSYASDAQQNNGIKIDIPDFPIFPIIISVAVFVLFTITLCIDYKKKPIAKCVLNIVAFGLLLLSALISFSATNGTTTANYLNTLIILLTVSTFLGFIGMAIMGIVAANQERDPAALTGQISLEDHASAPEANSNENTDIVGKLKTLKELHDAGVLNDEEYREKSSKYIDLL